MSQWAIVIYADFDVFQVFCCVSEAGNQPYHPCFGINKAYPRHLHAAKLNCYMTDLQEQFFLVGAMYDGFIALVQCNKELRVPLRFASANPHSTILLSSVCGERWLRIMSLLSKEFLYGLQSASSSAYVVVSTFRDRSYRVFEQSGL